MEVITKILEVITKILEVITKILEVITKILEVITKTFEVKSLKKGHALLLSTRYFLLDFPRNLLIFQFACEMCFGENSILQRRLPART